MCTAYKDNSVLKRFKGLKCLIILDYLQNWRKINFPSKCHVAFHMYLNIEWKSNSLFLKWYQYSSAKPGIASVFLPGEHFIDSSLKRNLDAAIGGHCNAKSFSFVIQRDLERVYRAIKTNLKYVISKIYTFLMSHTLYAFKCYFRSIKYCFSPSQSDYHSVS